MDFSGKVCLVTGSSRGIGAAAVLRFAQGGGWVVVNHRHSAQEAEGVAAEARAAGGEALVVQADVSRWEEAQRLVKTALERFEKVDVLVNNAGTTRDQLLALMKEEDWDTVLTSNLKSAFNCTKAVIRSMMKRRYGRIVNVSSVAGVMGNPGQTNYAASKAGLIGFTKSLAKELGRRGITCNAVAPGYVPTVLTQSMPQEAVRALTDTSALGRAGTPQEIAAAIAFLASDQASYITGQVLCVDGGLAF